MTQSDLAKRLDYKSHTAITAYEKGMRDPSIGTLSKLLASMGFELDIGISKKSEKRGI